MQMNITPIMSQMFKTQAYIKTFAQLVLTEQQKKDFSSNYLSNLKQVVLEFTEDHPGFIKDEDLLKERLKK